MWKTFAVAANLQKPRKFSTMNGLHYKVHTYVNNDIGFRILSAYRYLAIYYSYFFMYVANYVK